MKLLYTAAVVLQKKHSERLRQFLAERWQWLPDLFSAEFALPSSQLPDEILKALEATHQQPTGKTLNLCLLGSPRETLDVDYTFCDRAGIKLISM